MTIKDKDKKGPGTEGNGGKVTPISPAVARKLLKEQKKAEFARFKPQERALAVEAMNEILIEDARATMEAKMALEEGAEATEGARRALEKEIESLPQFDKKDEETLGSKFKGRIDNEASGFSDEPVRYLLAKLLNKWVIGSLTAVSAFTTGAQMYTNPENRNFVHILTGPFKVVGDIASGAAGFVYDNSTMFIYGATAALGLSILKRPTWKKRARRLFYAGAFFSTPEVFNDLVTNLQNGAKTLSETTSLSTTGAILGGGTVLSLVASFFLSDEIKHNEEKETAPKEPSKISSLLGAAVRDASWGISNAMSAVAGGIMAAASWMWNGITRKNKEAPVTPTMTMPAELAPTPVTEETGTSPDEEPLPKTEEMGEMGKPAAADPEVAAVESTAADGHPANPEPTELMGEETEKPESGDVLIPLDE